MNMTRTIYCDHAATSFPKAPGVTAAMVHYMDEIGANLSRSTYRTALDAALVSLETRERLCRLLGFPDPSHVILTPGNTFGLNTVLHGFVRPGDAVVVTSLEHNAVMRPLHARGAEILRIPCTPSGETDPDELLPLLQKKPRLAVFTHASNVCGTLQPIKALTALCRAHGVPVLLDAAQTAGHVPIDFAGWGLSALSVPGHKGLLGPAGIGALLLEKAFAKALPPLVQGGTGSASDREEQPLYMPDKFESGTLNIPGVYGLHAALSYIEDVGVATLREAEARLTRRFLRGIAGAERVALIGTADIKKRVGVVSLDFTGRDNAEIARRLETECGILTRVGLHCAPGAHKALGTFPGGTVRFSFGFGNTIAEIDDAARAVQRISGG